MQSAEIATFFQKHESKRQRTVVIVDFGNVEKWKHSLGWRVGVRELAKVAKHFSTGRRFLRRFYYGADYGPHEKDTVLTEWSKHILQTADMNGFFVLQKRVKYICSTDNAYGYEKKCDLDVEMAIDLVEEEENYDTIVLFSGDGDLVRSLRFLKEKYGKESIVMSARGHLGRELIDAKRDGIISTILYADDFEYRLNADRFKSFGKSKPRH